MSASIIYFPEIEGLKQETFLSSDTFIVPESVTKIMVLVVGGGSGGQNLGSGPSIGGSGGVVVFAPMNVVPLETLSITVGAGGAIGANGQDSLVSGSLQSVRASGGILGGRTYTPPFVGTQQNENSIYASAGAVVGGGGGGGASYGPGADGAQALVSAIDALPNTGGGGGGGSDPIEVDGSAGGSGRVHIYYASNN